MANIAFESLRRSLMTAIDWLCAILRVCLGYLPFIPGTIGTVFIGLLEGVHTLALHWILPLNVPAKRSALIAQAAKRKGGSPTVLITGATCGIGRQMLEIFCLADWNVYFIARSSEKANNVLKEMKMLKKEQNCTAVIADLSDLKSVTKAIKELKGVTFDVLINNAGIYLKEWQESESGHEMQFAVNHLSHFMLTTQLKLTPKTGRVINISSCAHFAGKAMAFPQDAPNRKSQFQRNGSYGQSKLCNLLFTNALNRRGIKAISVHPGAVATDIYRNDANVLFLLENVVYKFLSSAMMNPVEGCLTAVWAAIEQKEGNDGVVFGSYYWNFKKWPMNPVATKEQEESLWQYSEEVIKKYN